MKYVYHHLGLGDHIACQGMIRHLAESEPIVVFTLKKNLKNVSRLYHGADKIKFLPVENDAEVRRFLQFTDPKNYIIAGHEKLHEELARDIGARFDNVMYKLAGVPFPAKWEKFELYRDLKREKEVCYKELGIRHDEEFIFVHDDKARPIPADRLPSGIKIVRPDRMDIGIFDFLWTIEQAKEVHCIDSSFFNLIDCLKLRREGLFFHKYVKYKLVGEGGTPTFALNWHVYEPEVKIGL